MKKLFLIIFFLPAFLFSAPVGNFANPSTIEEGFFIPDTKPVSFRLGYQVCSTQDLLLQFNDRFKEQDFRIRHISSFCNFGTFTFNIKERLDIYYEMGSNSLMPTFTKNNLYYISKSENDILYRAGTKLIFFDVCDFSFAADINVSYFSSPSSYLLQNDIPIDQNLKFKLKEWQVSVGLSEKISILRPYIGVAYRDSRLSIAHFFHEKLKLKFKKKQGLVLGSGISLGSYVMLNLELRLVNERSTAFSAEVRF